MYDAENRLISVDDGTTASYVYGPEGRRVEENVGGVIKQFVYGAGGQKEIVLDGDSNVLRGEIDAAGRHAARERGSFNVTLAGGTIPEWDLSDWPSRTSGQVNATVRMAANSAGEVVDTYTSWPYGANLSQQGIVSDFHFIGKYHDSETGFDDFGARYYNETAGRFLTPDWSKNPEGIHYALSRSRPSVLPHD